MELAVSTARRVRIWRRCKLDGVGREGISFWVGDFWLGGVFVDDLWCLSFCDLRFMIFSDDSLVPGRGKRSCCHFGLKPPGGQHPRVHRTTWESKHIGLNVTLVIMASQPAPPNLPPPETNIAPENGWLEYWPFSAVMLVLGRVPPSEIRVRWGRVGWPAIFVRAACQQADHQCRGPSEFLEHGMNRFESTISTINTRWFKVTFLAWLSDPFQWLSYFQLGDEKDTLNHLAEVFSKFIVKKKQAWRWVKWLITVPTEVSMEVIVTS